MKESEGSERVDQGYRTVGKKGDEMKKSKRWVANSKDGEQ
jgi:hypothetical protein